MRYVFNTSRSCPISQLYLESSEYPIRFEIMKSRILFLKYILNQEKHSNISKMFYLQLSQPTKGDWASMVQQDLKCLKLEMSFEDIKTIKVSRLKCTIKKRIKEEALSYLLNIQRRKGKEIQYLNFQISDYLSPNEFISDIQSQQMLFNLRNRMLKLEGILIENQEKYCVCNKRQDIIHLYYCKQINSSNPKIEYNLIYNGSIEDQLYILRRMQDNINNEQTLMNEKKISQ